MIDGRLHQTQTAYSPVWLPPDSFSVDSVDDVGLRWSSLIVTWAAVGICYTGLFVLLKTPVSLPLKRVVFATALGCALVLGIVWLYLLNRPVAVNSFSSHSTNENDLSDLGTPVSTNTGPQR
jgi:hypothetical protein